MRCKQCDYVLWNLATRQCPECGESFKPSDYDFIPNQVRFCCPHCDQVYYGTTPQGQLEPSAFICVGCDTAVTTDEMILRPAEGATDTQARASRMPWLERSEGSVVRPWLATVGAALVRPGALMRSIPVGAGQWPAWRFMFFTCLIVTFLGRLLPGLLMGLAFFVLGRVFTGPNNPFAGIAIGKMVTVQMIGEFVVSIAYFAVLPFIWAGVTHAVLVITGGVAQPLRRTVIAISYSAAAYVISAIPCVQTVGIIWWAVSAIIMVKEAQRCHAARATAAVLVGSLVAFGLYLAGYFVLLFGTSGGPFGGTNMTAKAETVIVLERLVAAVDADGNGPQSALLLLNGNAASGQFIAAGASTDPARAVIGDTTLSALVALGPNRRHAAIDRIIAAQPPALAERIGDFVFTYHGGSFSEDGRLWVLMLSPDPEQRGGPGPPFDLIQVGRADGTVTGYPVTSFAAKLARQNDFRATVGLPPLPHPDEVLHGAPIPMPPSGAGPAIAPEDPASATTGLR
ncbi:MAG: hypothetical protein ACYTGR_10375 [Planctomycetota bacterium]|jgi:hypothetical protein